MEIQNYLKPNRVITFQEHIEIFSFRSEQNKTSPNYHESKANKTCVCTKELKNTHLYECASFNHGDIF